MQRLVCVCVCVCAYTHDVNVNVCVCACVCVGCQVYVDVCCMVPGAGSLEQVLYPKRLWPASSVTARVLPGTDWGSGR